MTNDPPTPSLVAVNANEYADELARSAFGDPRHRWAPGPDPGPIVAFGHHHGYSTTRLWQLDEATILATTVESGDSDTDAMDAQDIVNFSSRDFPEHLRRQPTDEDRAMHALAATGHEHVRFVDDRVYAYRTGLDIC